MSFEKREKKIARALAHSALLFEQEPMLSEVVKVRKSMQSCNVTDEDLREIVHLPNNPTLDAHKETETILDMLAARFQCDHEMALNWLKYYNFSLAVSNYAPAIVDQPQGTTSLQSMERRKELAAAIEVFGVSPPDAQRAIQKYTDAVNKDLGRSSP